MFRNFFLPVAVLLVFVSASAQKTYKPEIQYCDCRFKIDSIYRATAPPLLRADSIYPYKIDSSFQTRCGYLVVPENRTKAASKRIRLPFIVLQSKNPNRKKDPVLFTGGGPGNSSLQWINGMQRSSILLDRDAIAFEQRGTTYALPFLRSFELDTAIRESYRKNLNKDSMWLEGVKRYKKKMEKRGIDLSGYNSYETACDIDDLLIALKIDSVNLMGGSYSGGLMLSVLQKDPARVRSLILDSPLPMFTPIDEDEPANFNEGLHALFRHVEADSLDTERYGNLEQRFKNYFQSITGKHFYFSYLEKGCRDTLSIQYTKNELLEVIENNMLNTAALKDVPFIITEMIGGRHAPYIKKKLDDVFNRNTAPGAMRMLVYCADQADYHSEEVVKRLYALYPYMEGYRINDVWKAVCDCWKVPPLPSAYKIPFYSGKPVLIGDGEMDPACRPLYMLQVKHYMPNAQSFLFMNRTHGVGGKDFYEMTQAFLDDPYARLVPPNANVRAW